MAAKKSTSKKATDTKPEKDEVGNFTVFYRELLPSGKRDGATASKIFTSRKDAEKFAEKVDGQVR